MTLPADHGARHVRQRMLAEVGAEGQAHLDDAVVWLFGGTASSRAHAADYLERAGVTVLSDADSAAEEVDLLPLELLGPLTTPAALGPARDLLLGALTAVEGIKQLLDLGQPAELPANLFLLGDD
jgi:hypothetical protein